MARQFSGIVDSLEARYSGNRDHIRAGALRWADYVTNLFERRVATRFNSHYHLMKPLSVTGNGLARYAIPGELIEMHINYADMWEITAVPENVGNQVPNSGSGVVATEYKAEYMEPDRFEDWFVGTDGYSDSGVYGRGGFWTMRNQEFIVAHFISPCGVLLRGHFQTPALTQLEESNYMVEHYGEILEAGLAIYAEDASGEDQFSRQAQVIAMFEKMLAGRRWEGIVGAGKINRGRARGVLRPGGKGSWDERSYSHLGRYGRRF